MTYFMSDGTLNLAPSIHIYQFLFPDRFSTSVILFTDLHKYISLFDTRSEINEQSYMTENNIKKVILKYQTQSIKPKKDTMSSDRQLDITYIVKMV